MLDDRQELLDDRDRVDATLLQLADIRTELHVSCVDGFHRRVRFIARFDGRARMLMQRRDQTDVGDGLTEFVQRRDDVLFVIVVVVALTADTATRTDDDRPAPILLQDLADSDGRGDRVGTLRRIGQVDARVARNQRQFVFLDEPGEHSLALEPVDLPVEQFQT